jgi:NAD(P)-dependent dehydrogenase (short-subunit alcohol dehydrogenase family)
MHPHALITGGSRGIGLSIARLLALNNHRITLLSRNPSTLEAALSSLSPPGSDRNSHQFHRCIVGDVSSSQFWANDFAAEYSDGCKGEETSKGDIDILVNCAGITHESLFMRMREEQLETVMNTNLTGMMVGTRYLLAKKYFRAAKTMGEYEKQKPQEMQMPVIINVASLLGLKGGRGAVAYAASKAGVLGFTRALATELGPLGIRVNALVPGYIQTDMTEGTLNHPHYIARKFMSDAVHY